MPQPTLLRAGGLALAALALALAGVRVSLAGRWWLDVLVSAAWLVAAATANVLLARHPRVWSWITCLSGATVGGLALLERDPVPAALALVAIAAALAARAASIGWQRRAATVLTGLLLAAAGVLLDFPERPLYNTWMVPLLIMGAPLTYAAGAVVARTARAWNGESPAGDLLEQLERNGYTPEGARRAFVAYGAGLCLAAAAMPWMHPFAANLTLPILAAVAAGLSRPRAIRRAGLAAALIYAWATAVLIVFVASLRFGYLDPLFSQTLSGYRGWDFFLVPQAFDCLINGVSPYNPYPDPARCSYGPWATPFVLHPLASVVPGAALWALPPWTAYWVFVAASLACLGLLYGLFARLAASNLHRSLMFAALFANWPLYLILWLGQTHIFTVLAYGLVAYWLLRRQDEPAGGQGWLLAAGILISLFTKPLILLFLPALLAAPLTRRPAVGALGLYAIVSAAFVLVPALNPDQQPLGAEIVDRLALERFAESGNLYHWTNIVVTSGDLNTNHRDIHVLSNLLNVVLPSGVVLAVSRGLTVLGAGLVTWLAAKTRSAPRPEAARTLVLCATLMIALYYLTYTFAFEHQYPTLAIAAVVFVALIPRTPDRAARRWLALALAAYAPLLLPTIYRLAVHHPVRDILYDFSGETLEQMTVYKSFRVIPVLLMFIFNFLALRRLRLGPGPP